MSNKRTVNGNDVFSEAISLSSLKRWGQKYFTGREDVLVRKAATFPRRVLPGRTRVQAQLGGVLRHLRL